MKDEELIKKDWQLLMAHCVMMNQALLRTILENQAEILEKLGKGDYETNLKNFFNRVGKQHEFIDEITKKDIPDYPKL